MLQHYASVPSPPKYQQDEGRSKLKLREKSSNPHDCGMGSTADERYGYGGGFLVNSGLA